MKRILLFLFPLLPYLASAQVAKDTVTVLTPAQITAASPNDTANIYFVIANAWRKANFDSIARYTRNRFQTLTLDSTHIAANGISLQGTELTGTLPVSKGGTGLTTLTGANRIPYANSAATALTTSAGLTFDGTNFATTGNVGIGTTGPNARLHLSGNFEIDDALRISSTYGTGKTYRIKTQGANSDVLSLLELQSSNRLAFFGNLEAGIATNGSTRLHITSSGNVGIGTTGPQSKLEVNGVSSFADGSASAPSITNTGDLNTGMWYPADETIGFSTNGVERIRIKENGQVRFIPLAADPAGAEDGDVYYNSATNKLRVRAGGAWVDLH